MLSFKELETRMNTEGFNPDLFFKHGVVVEATFNEYYPYAHGKRLRPEGFKSLPTGLLGFDSWELVKNSFLQNELIKEYERKSGKDRREFSFVEKDALKNKMMEYLEENE